ncbi:hypothetical protein N7492_006327 [Penicillium capsulatum]|uniref:Postreplication repair E3 ubiquitin-protein ligase RAD18 n=1 Tax=Penicillium capsulatum TaxID=69766 RepID=A0A9W9LMF1_9EURO|nr:hypothetical protein N7492_006327 [Penicillium capsulatum]KAJ6108976.1 hypothetical protein N7512_008813 [Penicillium capsulatum]
MEQSFDLPDSTDWLDTPLSLLAPLESSLRCQVCKDWFDNPVITSCSHTFCSLCIRRCLSTEGKCPTCRSSDQELKLRRNWAVQEFVETFQNARTSVLELARKEAARRVRAESQPEEPSSKKRKVAHDEPPQPPHLSDSSPQRIRTRSQRVQEDAPGLREEPEVIEDSQDEGDEDIASEAADSTLVACPICQRKMKEDAVFNHLNSCPAEDTPSPRKQTAFNFLQRPAQGSPPREMERLPAMNYSLLKDHQLRKKFRDLGIPEWGTRPLLIRRHTEWMNLWNANCDSRNPKVKRDLLKELDTWEKTQGGLAMAPSSFENNSVMRKDFNADEWSASHNTDFKRLIANARKRSDVQIRSTIPDASTDTAGPVEDPSVRTEKVSLSVRASADANADVKNQSFDPSR